MSRKPRNRVWYQCNKLKSRSECSLCDNIMVKDAKRGEEGEWHVEHVWALSCGGPDIYPNLIPICKRCNLKMKKNCKSTFHHLANEGFIDVKVAEKELLRHKRILLTFDPQCTAITGKGERCLNHKCGKKEKWCYIHTVQNAKN